MVDNLPKNVEQSLTAEIWRQIKQDMENAIIHENGAGKIANPYLKMLQFLEKTGTAENPHGKEDHAWFIGWISFAREFYSVVVLMENAGSGGTKAAPIAKQVFRVFINIPLSRKSCDKKK